MLLTLTQIATILSTDEGSVLAMVRDGVMPPPMMTADGRLVRWSEEDIRLWIRGGLPRCVPPTDAEFDQIRRILNVACDVVSRDPTDG